jgi:hypothetical protein
MNKRPRSITVIGWIFIVCSAIALLSGLVPPAHPITEFTQQPLEFLLIQVVRILGVLAGAFILYGYDWARWLLVAWLAFHVVLSAFHSPFELMVHSLLAGVVGYFLFRPLSGAFFRSPRAGPPETSKADGNRAG